jgi:hypothetical protein
MAVALRTELASIAWILEENAKDLAESKSDFTVPDVDHSVRVMPQMISKFGLLDADAIRKTIHAYILVEQYCERLLMLGGILSDVTPRHRRLVLMQEASAKHVAIINEVTATEIKKAISALDRYLQLSKRRPRPQT